MKIGILNSGGYNINSIKFAMNRIGIEDIIIVRSKNEFDTCDKIIIPGVGHAKTAMDLIYSQNLFDCIKATKKPTLGICLGMQIMFLSSQEGNINCLNIIEENIVRLPQNVKIPQMGWNMLQDGKYSGEFVYFANSYFAPINKYTKSYVDYFGVRISAIVEKDNFIGCQFHPEKSSNVGAKILRDFINI